MDILIPLFENLYWIDILIITIMLIGYALWIRKTAKKILKKNTAYNAQLLAMRTEIYMEYERNFFL